MFMKRLSLLLSIILMFSAVSVIPVPVSARESEIAEDGANVELADEGYYDYSTFNSRLDACQNNYPHGSYSSWQAPAGWSECWAYANRITCDLFGSYGCNWSHHQDRSSIYPGDLIRYGGYYGTGHSIVVTAVDGDTIYYTDRNGTSSYNMVRWGASINRWNINFVSGDSGRQGIYHAPNWDSVIPWKDPIPPTPIGHVMSESEAAGRTIPDGDYWICSRISQDYFIDVPGDDFNTSNGKNLKTWIWNASASADYLFPGKWDVFHFTYLNNGFYRITQYNTNMAIDVDSASLYRGTNVQLWEVNDSNAQQWSIEITKKGYQLRAKCNSYYMDISGGDYNGDANVQTWEGNDTDAQYFGLIPYAPDERPLSDGVYTIGSALGKTVYLDVSGTPEIFTSDSNVQIWNGSDYLLHPDEKYRFEYVKNGYYRIYEYESGLAVEIHNHADTFLNAGQNAKLYSKNNSRGQLWKIRKNSDGTYCFFSLLAGYCLDVDGAGTANGTNVEAYLYNDTSAQKWKPVRVLQDNMVTVNDVSITSEDTAVTPQVTVKVDNKTLTKDTDYTVTTTADIASGKGTVTIVGKNNYCNTITKEFNISCALLDKAVTVNNMTITSDVTEIKPQVTVKANGKTLKVDTDYTLTIDADIAGGTGTVTATGKNGYTGTITKSFQITIDDKNKITDSMGNRYYAYQGEIVTFIISLTSPRQVNYLNGILYYNQEIMEPIITDDIGYHAPSFVNGQFHILTPGQIEFDVYSNKPVSLNNTTIVKMQFRLTTKGKEGWLAHEFKTPEFTWDNQGNYELETQVLTNQELYDPTVNVLGDADGDGDISSIDVTLIQRYNAFIDTGVDDDVLMNADVDGNGELEIVDATWIQRYLAFMDVPYAIGEEK